MYKVYKVKKKSGGHRTITEPFENLKEMLSELKEVLDLVPLSEYAHGFVPNRSPYTNAMQHRSKAYVLNIDLKDFFPSVKQERMMAVLRGKVSEVTLQWVEHLCFHNGELPQGSPCSPVLSNIYMIDIDEALALISSKKGWSYTRYADDITFSGPIELKTEKTGIIKALEALLHPKGLRVNYRKVKLTQYSQCQRVTGIVVNNEKLTLPGKVREELFQAALGASLSDLGPRELGYLEYVRSVDPKFYEKLCKRMNQT